MRRQIEVEKLAHNVRVVFYLFVQFGTRPKFDGVTKTRAECPRLLAGVVREHGIGDKDDAVRLLRGVGGGAPVVFFNLFFERRRPQFLVAFALKVPELPVAPGDYVGALVAARLAQVFSAFVAFALN